MKRLVLPGCFVVLLALTNAWPDFSEGYERLGQTDTASYSAIALASPGIPQSAVDYRHAQRFWLPWTIGAVAKYTHVPLVLAFRTTDFLLFVAVVWTFSRILQTLQVSSDWQTVLLAGAIFDPYHGRYYLAVPFMVTDLLFLLGFAVTILGFVRKNFTIVAVGLTVAATGRQTALAVIGGLWILLGSRWRSKDVRSSDVIKLLAASMSAVAIYWLGGAFAQATGAANENIVTVTGHYEWLFSDDPHKVGTILEFCLRGLPGLGPALVLIIPLLVITPLKPRMELGSIAFLSLSICIQPLLGGPAVTSNNISRLTSFAHIGLLTIAGLLANRSGKSLRSGVTIIVCLLMFVASLHHQWSLPGQLLSGPLQFGVLMMCSYMLAAISVWMSITQEC